ncbi:MAG: sigma-70 family RNA polymerase sigma factor [bacterium]
MDENALVRSWAKAYGPRIKNLARRMLMDESLADDILQETLLDAWKARESFEGRSEVSTWLYRIALNRILREKEKLRRGEAIARDLEDASRPREVGLDPWCDTGIADPVRELAEREIAAEIGERCQWYYTFLLTAEQRSVFILREVLDLEYAEIAAVLEVSVDVVRSRLKRARERIQSHLRKRCSLVDPTSSCHCEARIPYVLAKYPAILEKYKRNLSSDEIAKRLSLLERTARARLPFILEAQAGSKTAKKRNTGCSP